jgi:hypothetical protein
MVTALTYLFMGGLSASMVIFGLGAALMGATKDESPPVRTSLDQIRDDMRSIEPPPLRKRMN